MTLHDCTMGCRVIDCPKLSTLTTKFLDLRLLSASALARPIVQPPPRATIQSAVHPTSVGRQRSPTFTGGRMLPPIQALTGKWPCGRSPPQSESRGARSYDSEAP